MLKHTRTGVAALICAPLLAINAWASEPDPQCALAGPTMQAQAYAATRGPDVAEGLLEQQRLHRWLTESFDAATATVTDIPLTRTERSDIGHIECDDCQTLPREQRYLVGVSKPLNRHVDFATMAESSVRSGQSFAGGQFSRSATGLGWAATLASSEANAMRLLIRDISLPEDAALFVHNERGEAFGPYVADAHGQVWTNTVSGDRITLTVHIFGDAAERLVRQVRFEIAEVVHLGPRFVAAGGEDSTRALCSNNANCVEDARCYNNSDFAHINDARYGVAHMLFTSGPWAYICSGGLIADTGASQTPYFLTANHCISRASEASSLETYWQFWTSSCGGSCYSPYGGAVPRALGSSLLAGGSDGDFTLLQLDEDPPAGSVFLGWTNDTMAFATGTELYRISHPKGSPQAFSHHTVRTSGPHCTSIPRGSYIYSQDQIGATEGGSSGSPVLNASGQIVGQLYGACGFNLNDVCDSASNSTVDGALAHYFNHVAQWLTGGGTPPGDGSLSVAAIELSVRARGPWRNGVATVTVVDDNGAPVANATVSGGFSGDVSGSAGGTTNSNGQVALESDRIRASNISFSFCVDDIAHPSGDYAPGNDCDSL